MNYPQHVLKWTLDTIFPVRCMGCGKFSDKPTEYICRKCVKKIPLRKDFECIGCKTKTVLGKTCPNCKDTNPIDQLIAVSDYQNKFVVKIIKTFKYRLIEDLAQPISRLMKKHLIWLNATKKFNILSDDPIITPVPLHPRRLNWRGFNQSELIAKSLADGLNCRTEPGLLVRSKATIPQADIKEREPRLTNIRGTFKLAGASDLKNRTILLVDDICTTGATLNECADTLKKGGAAKVIGLVIARG